MSGTCVCASPTAPCPGSQPGTTAKQKVPFPGRSDLALSTSTWLSLGGKRGFQYMMVLTRWKRKKNPSKKVDRKG